MSPLVGFYIATAIISLLIAFFLVAFSRASAQAKLNRDKIKFRQPRYEADEVKSDSREVQDEALRQELFQKVSETLAITKAQGQEAAKLISETIGREVEQKIAAVSQQMRSKYESLIEERAKSEEIAWKKYKSVLTEKQSTDAVIRSVAEGLLVVDSKGKVLMMNPAAEKLLGVSRKEKMGKSLMEGLKDEQLVSLVKDQKDQSGREIEVISQDDETKKVLRASSAVIENEEGQTIGMVSVLSDITKQKELDRMKANFIASVSHELRTPLVAIEKSIALILGKTVGDVPPAQEQFLAIADRNLKRLSRLINDLLDLSKLEAGRMELKKQNLPLEPIFTEVLATLDTWAQTKSIQLKKAVDEGLPEIPVDPDRLTQVLVNLIGNAIKFTPQGGSITLKAVLKKEEGCIVLSVTDTGIGISPENIPKVFDKFYQIGERASTDISGTGIGLSIAKEIVELHGGRIWVESKKGEGTTFSFTLPLT